MIEAVMLWNEPNNASHWDFALDPDWAVFASMVKLSAAAVRAESPGLTPKWLGLELSLTTGAVTALLDRLAKAGHLDRVSNPQDRRSVLLRLTDSGTALLAAVDARYDAVSVEVLRASPRLGEEEVVEDLARAAAVITAHTIA